MTLFCKKHNYKPKGNVNRLLPYIPRIYMAVIPILVSLAAAAANGILIIAATEKYNEGNDDHPYCAVIKKIAKTVHLVASFRQVKDLRLCYYSMPHPLECDFLFYRKLRVLKLLTPCAELKIGVPSTAVVDRFCLQIYIVLIY